MSSTIPELRPLLHIANLLTSEMVHFVHQLAYYITFEVRHPYSPFTGMVGDSICSFSCLSP